MIDSSLRPASRDTTYNQILESHHGLIMKVVRTYCRFEEDQDDLFQEICIQLWRALPKYNGSVKMSTWLYRIALNVAISHYRKNASRRNNTELLTSDVAAAPDVDFSDHERRLAQLNQFIYELDDLNKALMLLYLDEKPHTEIAEILGLSVSNVGTKIGRIKTQLRNRFSLEGS